MIQTINNLLRSPAHRLVICVALLCISLQYAGLDDVLRWERSLIDQGQWWLLLTGNFVHLGQSHLWMNIAGFILVVALVWSHFSTMQWFLVIVFSSMVVGVGLWFFNPEVTGYVGFSGTLHGLIIAGCLADLRTYPKSAAILLTLVIAKLTWEQLSGPLPGSESTAGGSVLVDSHLYGAIGGAIIGAALIGFIHLRKRQTIT